MAVTVKELRDWLNKQNSGDMIAVDDSGLTVVIYACDATLEERQQINDYPDTYFELGGVPVEEDE